MPGPTPKPNALRQRRNKSATRTTLPAEREPRELSRTPYLPTCPNGDPQTERAEWHPMARRWWKDVWSSPMSGEFLKADEPALLRLVVLVDQFWKTGKLDVAKEIRMLEREFGLTPLSRRRLEWTVAQADEAKDKMEQRRFKRAKTVDVDPRGILGE